MLRILLIITIVGYILYKLGFFRVYIHSDSRERRTSDSFNRRPTDGNVHIDSVPDKDKKSPTYKGGEYIDYEEVK